MHDDLIPSCDHCKKFVFAFAKSSPLAGWGFCLDECGGAVPGQAVLAELEEAHRRGDEGKLFSFRGLYEEAEDGCDKFQPH